MINREFLGLDIRAPEPREHGESLNAWDWWRRVFRSFTPTLCDLFAEFTSDVLWKVLLMVPKSQTKQPPLGWCEQTRRKWWDFNYRSLNWWVCRISTINRISSKKETQLFLEHGYHGRMIWRPCDVVSIVGLQRSQSSLILWKGGVSTFMDGRWLQLT